MPQVLAIHWVIGSFGRFLRALLVFMAVLGVLGQWFSVLLGLAVVCTLDMVSCCASVCFSWMLALVLEVMQTRQKKTDSC